MTLHLAEAPDKTLVDLLNDAQTSARASRKIANDFKVDLLGDEPSITFTTDAGKASTEKVPATVDGVEQIVRALQIPVPFYKRLPRELKQQVITGLLEANKGDRLVKFIPDERIMLVKKPNALILDTPELLEATARVVSPEAPVHNFWSDDEFRLDVTAPELKDYAFAVGGDKKVGDLTRGGVRIDCKLSRGLAPTVSQYLYRLACTNGMEVLDDAYKIDARGSSNEEILKDFERQADLAFRAVGRKIEAFYEMRGTPVDNPERWLVRFARERGIPERTTTSLLARAASEDLPDDPTEFDLINLVTNEANSPAMIRDGGRRILQRAGGGAVVDHAARCGHCKSKLQ